MVLCLFYFYFYFSKSLDQILIKLNVPYLFFSLKQIVFVIFIVGNSRATTTRTFGFACASSSYPPASSSSSSKPHQVRSLLPNRLHLPYVLLLLHMHLPIHCKHLRAQIRLRKSGLVKASNNEYKNSFLTIDRCLKCLATHFAKKCSNANGFV